MTFNANPSSPAVRAALVRREAELAALLGVDTSAADARDVADFKDLAAGEAIAAVEDVQAAHAAAELAQVQAALRRLEDGSYGQCRECGEAIDPRRLAALPATPVCTACQSAHERAA